MIRRLDACLLAVVLAAGTLSGCGNTQNKSVRSSSAQSERTPGESPDIQGESAQNESLPDPSARNTESSSKDEVLLDFWTIDLKKNFKDFFNDLIKDYEKSHPGITIEWTDVSYDDISGKLDEAIDKGDAPDVVNLNTQFALNLAGQDALTDLNTVLTDQQKSVYSESLWDSTTIGGSSYALPWYASPDIMFYNKDLLKAGGLTKPPKTMEEALSLAADFRKKTGAFLFTPDEYLYLLIENEIPILSEDRQKAVFNTEKAAKLLTGYKKAADAGDLPRGIWGNWDDELALYESSQLATISSSGSSLEIFRNDAPYVYKKTGISQPLVGSSGFSGNALMNLVVPAASQHPNEAVDFALYVTDDDNQLAFCKLVSVFPSTKKAGADPFFQSDMDTLEGQASAMSAESSLYSQDFSLGVEDQDTIQDIIYTAGDNVVLHGQDPKKALDQAAEEVDQILAKHQ